jgi:hypothetical protein
MEQQARNTVLVACLKVSRISSETSVAFLRIMLIYIPEDIAQWSVVYMEKCIYDLT